MATPFFSSIAIALLLVGPALVALAVRRSLAIPWQALLLGACLLYGGLPLLVALAGARLAEQFGCEAYAAIYECSGSAFLGELVTLMVFAHWAAILTIPSGLLGVVGLIILMVLTAFRSRSAAPTASPANSVYRRRQRRAIAGICAAISQRWGWSLLGIRIATVVLAVLMPLLIVGLYLWLWLAFPLEPTVRAE